MDILKRQDKREKCVVALGNFDGLHLAHMAIIDNCVREARKRRIKSAVLFFFEHTQNITDKKQVRLISDASSKLKLVEKAGVDIVFMRHFNKEFMELSPCEFVDFLKRELNASVVCVGYDYRFGHKAEGDIVLLKNLCADCGIDVFITDEIDFNGIPVKSTVIRKHIEAGSIEQANAMLGRNFTICGEIEKGFQNGRKIGIPTANVKFSECVVLPKDGVYMGYTTLRGKRYKSLINVGNNPTVDGKRTTVESHILDFDEDIYGEIAEVEFCKRIRGEIKFASLEELKKQIRKDIEVIARCI